MPNLLQINTTVNTRAPGRIVEEIGKTAIVAGWSSYIAYGRYERESASEIIKIGNGLSVLSHGLKTCLFDRHGFGSRFVTLDLIKRINEAKPDIIHLHNIHGYYVNIEILFNYLSDVNIPVVWTLHDAWPFTGHCSYFDIAKCNKWETECFSCPQRKEYPSSLWMDNSRRNFQDKLRLFNSVKNLTLVPVSMWIERLVKKSFLKHYPQKQIYNGVDLNIFKPLPDLNEFKHRLDIRNRFMILGVASLWNLRKGFKDFLELSRITDDSVIIVLVGLSKKQIQELPSNIIGIPRTENISQLAELYSAADLYLNLTYEDNFPTTNLEALACGTPVLTYNTGGSIEAVSPETGFIIEKGDFSSVMDIIRIVKTRGKSSYVKACRDRAEKLYDKNERNNDYINLYKSLLDFKIISE